jgi:hypothetical protein
MYINELRDVVMWSLKLKYSSRWTPKSLQLFSLPSLCTLSRFNQIIVNFLAKFITIEHFFYTVQG